MHARSLSPIASLLAITLLAACKTSAPPAPTAEPPAEPSSESPAPRVDRDDAAEVKPPIPEISLEDRRSVYTALGCPSAELLDSGCLSCPTAREAWTLGDPADDSVLIEVRPGRYMPGAERDEVLATFDGCHEHLAGVYRHTQLVHLARQDDGAWAVVSAASVEDLGEPCQHVKSIDGTERTLCALFSGRQGVYFTTLKALSWGAPRPSGEGSGLEPMTRILLQGSQLMDCEANASVSYETQIENVDLDGNGSLDVKLTVRSYQGPYRDDPELCREGGAGARSPAREVTEEVLQWEYLSTPQGYSERSGQFSEVGMREEFYDLL